jgi:hypothetical protein
VCSPLHHPQGFLLFVSLAWWFASHPPTPLAVTSEHLEHLWHGVQGRFSHLRQDLASLEGRVVGSVVGSVQEGVHALSDKMQHFGEDLIHGMHLDAVAAGLQEGLHGLQEGIQHKVGLGDVCVWVSACARACLCAQGFALMHMT